MRYQQILEAWEEIISTDVWRKSILGAGQARSKTSETGVCLASSGESNKPMWVEQISKKQERMLYQHEDGFSNPRGR